MTVALLPGSQGGTTMKKGMLVLAALALAACTKTGENEYEVERPGLVVDTVKTPELTTKIDTLSVPVVGTQKDTIIIDKPVVGTKKTEVKVPTVKKPPADPATQGPRLTEAIKAVSPYEPRLRALVLGPWFSFFRPRIPRWCSYGYLSAVPGPEGRQRSNSVRTER
jgi:hypothetical protein